MQTTIVTVRNNDSRWLSARSTSARPAQDEVIGTRSRPEHEWADHLALRVLVVDDHPVHARFSRRQLESLGHRVRSAASRGEALRAVGQEAFEVVLLNCIDQLCDDADFLAGLRRSHGPSQRPLVIGLTPRLTPAVARRCRCAELDDVLVKPLRIGDWRAFLDRWALTRAAVSPDRRARL